MASMTFVGPELEDLRKKVSQLATAADSLPAMLQEEALRLQRNDQVARLKALHSTIQEEATWAERGEMAARRGQSEVKAIASVMGLGGALLGAALRNERLLRVSQGLAEATGRRDSPFGTVLVSVGPKGLPEDVKVIFISRWAREYGHDETVVMNELEKRGHLLFSLQDFSLLIDRLADEVLKGNATPRVGVEALSKIRASFAPRLRPLKLADH
ncbi:MAG: hypothetical protein HY665_05535 [Chloroflexi bacterium]|nr:hypothetical protein [Chloroflexota bacterium]